MEYKFFLSQQPPHQNSQKRFIPFCVFFFLWLVVISHEIIPHQHLEGHWVQIAINGNSDDNNKDENEKGILDNLLVIRENKKASFENTDIRFLIKDQVSDVSMFTVPSLSTEQYRVNQNKEYNLFKNLLFFKIFLVSQNYRGPPNLVV